MSTPDQDSVRTFFGVALVAIGALMTVLSGLCTGVFLLSSLLQPSGMQIAILALPIGGIPLAVGLLLFWWGRRLLKSRPAAEPPRQ
jgi:hypothetical protein